MSVLRIPVSVMKMQIVLTATVRLVAFANRDSPEMEQHVMVSELLNLSSSYLNPVLVIHHLFSFVQTLMNVRRIPVPATKMQTVPTPKVLTDVIADKDLLEMGTPVEV